MAVAATVGGANIREPVLVAVLVDVHAVSDGRTVFLRIRQDADHGAAGDVDYVVNRTASIRKSRQVARQEAESLLVGNRCRRNSSVEAEQIRDWTCIVRSAPRTDRSRVHNQWEQVGTRRGRNRNV